MYKISGLNLFIFYSNFYLTKCGGYGIIVNSARKDHARAARLSQNKEVVKPLLRKLDNPLFDFSAEELCALLYAFKVGRPSTV